MVVFSLLCSRSLPLGQWSAPVLSRSRQLLIAREAEWGGLLSVGFPQWIKINVLLYLASCRVIVSLGRKRPYVEVLGLISFAPSEVRSYEPSRFCRTEEQYQPRPGQLVSMQVEPFPCLDFLVGPKDCNSFRGKEEILKIGLKDNNGACVESGSIQHHLFSEIWMHCKDVSL